MGGGFLSIDEFLDQYTPAELDKIERNDPLKKFSEKMALQKTSQGRVSSLNRKIWQVLDKLTIYPYLDISFFNYH